MSQMPISDKSHNLISQWEPAVNAGLFIVGSAVIGSRKIVEWINGPLRTEGMLLASIVNGAAVISGSLLAKNYELNETHQLIIEISSLALGSIATPYIASTLLAKTIFQISLPATLAIGAINVTIRVTTYTLYKLYLHFSQVPEVTPPILPINTPEDVQNLSLDKLAECKGDFDLNKEKWINLSISMQMAFNKEWLTKGPGSIHFSKFTKEIPFSEEEFLIIEQVHKDDKSKEFFSFLYNNHRFLQVDRAAYSEEMFSLIPTPLTKGEVEALSENQIRWHHYLLCQNNSKPLQEEVKETLAKNFLKLHLTCPSKEYSLLLDKPADINALDPYLISWFFYDFENNERKWKDLSFREQVAFTTRFTNPFPFSQTSNWENCSFGAQVDFKTLFINPFSVMSKWETLNDMDERIFLDRFTYSVTSSLFPKQLEDIEGASQEEIQYLHKQYNAANPYSWIILPSELASALNNKFSNNGLKKLLVAQYEDIGKLTPKSTKLYHEAFTQDEIPEIRFTPREYLAFQQKFIDAGFSKIDQVDQIAATYVPTWKKVAKVGLGISLIALAIFGVTFLLPNVRNDQSKPCTQDLCPLEPTNSTQETTNHTRLLELFQSRTQYEKPIEKPPSSLPFVTPVEKWYSFQVDLAEDICITTNVADTGWIGADKEFNFSDKIKDATGKPLQVASNDIYIPIIMSHANQYKFYFPPYLPSTLLHGLKEGDTIRFYFEDKLIQLTLAQNNHPHVNGKRPFEEMFQSITTYVHKTYKSYLFEADQAQPPLGPFFLSENACYTDFNDNEYKSLSKESFSLIKDMYKDSAPMQIFDQASGPGSYCITLGAWHLKDGADKILLIDENKLIFIIDRTQSLKTVNEDVEEIHGKWRIIKNTIPKKIHYTLKAKNNIVPDSVKINYLPNNLICLRVDFELESEEGAFPFIPSDTNVIPQNPSINMDPKIDKIENELGIDPPLNIRSIPTEVTTPFLQPVEKLDRSQVAFSGNICIATNRGDLGWIGADKRFDFSNKIKDENGNRLIIKPKDMYIPIYLTPSSELPSILPNYLPASLFNGLKEGDVIRFYFEDKLIQLSLDQKNHPHKDGKSNFELFLERIRDYQSKRDHCFETNGYLFTEDHPDEHINSLPFTTPVERWDSSKVDLSGDVYITTNNGDSGWIGADATYKFSRKIKDEKGAPIVIFGKDIYVPITIKNDAPKFSLPSYLPSSLFNGLKEGDTIRFYFEEKLIQLTLAQQSHAHKNGKGNFEEFLQSTQDYVQQMVKYYLFPAEDSSKILAMFR